MFDDNDGDDLEDRDFLESFVAEDDESMEEDNNVLERNLGIQDSQMSNLSDDGGMISPPTRVSTSVSTINNSVVGLSQSFNVSNSNAVRSLPFTRQASSISSSSNNVAATILNPANVALPVSLPVARKGVRSVASGQGEINSFGGMFMQSMIMNQMRWDEERKERAEERDRREEQRIIKEQERERERQERERERIIRDQERERERIVREQERDRERQSFMQMMVMMMSGNKSKKDEDHSMS